MAKIKSYSTEIVGTLIIFTILFSGSGGDGATIWSFGDFVCPTATTCYIEGTVKLSGYSGTIEIDTSRMRVESDNSALKSSEGFKQDIIQTTIDSTSTVEKSFKCDYSVSDSLSAKGNGKNKCVRTIETVNGSKELNLFDKEYKSYDKDTKTFTYDEYEKIKTASTKKVYNTGKITVEEGETIPLRYEIQVEPNSYGKADLVLCFTVDGEELCATLDPNWDSRNTYYRNIYNASVMTAPINSSQAYGSSDIDNDGTVEWIYANNCSGSEERLYYNDSSAVAGAIIDDTTACYYFSTSPFSIGTAYSETPTNLILYSPLDGGRSTVIDFAGSNNATATNVVTVTGKIYNASLFNSDSSNGKISYPSGAVDAIKDNQQGAVSFWLNISHTDTQVVFSLNDFDDAGDYLIFAVNNSHIYGDIGFGATWRFEGQTAIATTGWAHIVIMSNSTTNYFYINGAKETVWWEEGSNDGSWFGDTLEGQDTVTIGALDRLSPYGYLKGAVDDFRIFDRNLTGDEVQALYKSGAYLGLEQASTVTSENITVRQWADVPTYSGTEIVWNLHVWVYNNRSSAYTDINVTPDSNFSSSYTIASLASGHSDERNFTYTLTRGLTADADFSIARTTINGTGVGGIGNTLQLLNPVDPVAKAYKNVTVTWEGWPGKNDSTTFNYTTITLSTNETSNCSLNFDGTYYHNTTRGLNHSFWISPQVDGNYTPIQVKCENGTTSKGTSSYAWWNIDTHAPVVSWRNAPNNISTEVSTKNLSADTDERVSSCVLSLNGTDYSMSQNTTTNYYYEWTLGNQGNYSSIYVTCNDTLNNTGTSSSGWLRYDINPPQMTWGDWVGKNSTITVNSTTMDYYTNERVTNCTFNFNGTWTQNNTAGSSFSYFAKFPVYGTYNVSVRCVDTLGHSGISSGAWTLYNAGNVNLSISVAGGQSFIDWRPENFSAQTIEPYLQDASSAACILNIENLADTVNIQIGRTTENADVQVRCDDDTTLAGAVNLTATYQTLYSSLTNGSSIDVCCWAVLAAGFNVTHYGDIAINAELT